MHKMDDDQQLVCLLELYNIICQAYCLVVNDFFENSRCAQLICKTDH